MRNMGGQTVQEDRLTAALELNAKEVVVWSDENGQKREGE